MDLLNYTEVAIIPKEMGQFIKDLIGYSSPKNQLIINISREFSSSPYTEISGYSVKMPIPESESEIWLAVGEDALLEPYSKIAALMTHDIQKLIVIVPSDDESMKLIYMLLRALRSVNTHAKVVSGLEIDPSGTSGTKLNLMSYVSALLTYSLVNSMILYNPKRLKSYLTTETFLDHMKWCARGLEKLLNQYVLGDVKYYKNTLLQLTCFRSEARDAFKDLGSFVEFSKFVNWGTHFTAREGMIYIEGPRDFIDEIEVRAASRREGWTNYVDLSKENSEVLGIVLLEEGSSLVTAMLDECKSLIRIGSDVIRSMNLYMKTFQLIRDLEEKVLGRAM